MKNIPETDTISRLSLSGKGWKGSGFPVMGFTLSTWEYLASNWGRSSSWNKRKDLIWCSISLNYQKNQAECDIKKIPDIKLFFFLIMFHFKQFFLFWKSFEKVPEINEEERSFEPSPVCEGMERTQCCLNTSFSTEIDKNTIN